jgi:hypothetical protein
MTYCEQCGSTSFDEQGFCQGCGARLPGYAPALAPVQAQPVPAVHPGKAPGIVLPEAPKQTTIFSGLWGFVQPDVKNVWVAVVLALIFGPFGMTYSTYLGALVMFAVSFFAWFFIKNLVILSLLPVICAVWAGLAARSANSIY